MFRTTCVGLAFALLGASADATESVPVTRAEQSPGVEVAAAIGAVGLARSSARFAPGDPVSRLGTGADCGADSVSEWSELLTRRVRVELANAFRSELARGSTETLTALRFRAVVDEVRMQVCHTGPGAWQGGFRVRVTWTAQEPGSDRILYQGSTTGAYDSARIQTRPAAEGLRKAMVAAVRDLIADQRLVDAARAQVGSGQRLAAAD